jgi:hypothetical protein
MDLSISQSTSSLVMAWSSMGSGAGEPWAIFGITCVGDGVLFRRPLVHHGRSQGGRIDVGRVPIGRCAMPWGMSLTSQGSESGGQREEGRNIG